MIPERFTNPSIAMVGTDNPLTASDWLCLILAVKYGLRARELEDLDVINLKYGRDFLAENHCYLGVVLCNIFHLETPTPGQSSVPGTLQSPLHNIERWRERLIATQARMIVVWELRTASLSGRHLRDMLGYRITFRNSQVTVYRRNPTPEAALRGAAGASRHPPELGEPSCPAGG